MADSSSNKIKVLFIGGYGRSGSTILDRLIGSIDGCFSAGEIRHIWKRGFFENQLCGCNLHFHDCKFWKSVIDELFGGIENFNYQEIQSLRNEVDRARHIPSLLFPRLQSTQLNEKLQKYQNILKNILGSIQKKSNCNLIIDSSKDPIQGFLLNSISDLDLYIIHLVRDSRAVSYSWQRQRIRPEIDWKKEYMPQYSIWKSSTSWMQKNLMMEFLKIYSKNFLRISYEDFINSPQENMNKIIEFVNLDAKNFDISNSLSVDLNVNHTISGNPIRFKTGSISLNPDLEWVNKMNPYKYFLCTILTTILLKRYGYSLLR